MTETRTCPECGGGFTVPCPGTRKQYCSPSCAARVRNRGRAQPTVVLACQECGGTFTPASPNRKRLYCSTACHQAARRANPAPPVVRACPECGGEFIVPYPSNPRQYCSQSCGSAQWARRRTGEINSNWRGGKTFHPLYDTYQDMVARCTRPKHTRYADYGGRGITVCQRWRDDFWNFVADMGERPDGMSIDRRDNDGSYSPENCRWAGASTQMRNRRPAAYAGSVRDSTTGRFQGAM